MRHHRRHCHHQRPQCSHCRYPAGTPLHQRTAHCVKLTAATIGLWGLVWAGLAIHARWGARGAWIYFGALVLAGVFGQINPAPAPPRTPPATVVTVVTVTAPAPRP